MDVAVGVVLIVGDAVAHGHQMVEIARENSAKGISTTSIVMNFVSSALVFANLMILSGRAFFVDAFFDGVTVAALSHWMAVLQVVTSCVLTGVLCAVYVVYAAADERRRAAAELALCAFFVAGFGGGSWLSGLYRALAIGLGIAATAVSVLTWIPQIWLLFRSRSTGELSIVLILAHAVGAILLVFFQAVLNREHWSTWVSGAFMGAEQFLMLALWARARINPAST